MHLAAAPHRTRGREHRIHRRAARFSHASRIAHRPSGPGPVAHVSPRILGARPSSPRDDDPARVAFGEKWVGAWEDDPVHSYG